MAHRKDGYTVVRQSLPFVVNPALTAKMPFQTTAFAPVSLMIALPFVLAVNNSVPAKSVKAAGIKAE